MLFADQPHGVQWSSMRAEPADVYQVITFTLFFSVSSHGSPGPGFQGHQLTFPSQHSIEGTLSLDRRGTLSLDRRGTLSLERRHSRAKSPGVSSRENMHHIVDESLGSEFRTFYKLTSPVKKRWSGGSFLKNDTIFDHFWFSFFQRTRCSCQIDFTSVFCRNVQINVQILIIFKYFHLIIFH